MSHPYAHTHSPSLLLALPAELRHKIWIFAFANTSAIPLESSRIRRRDTGAAYDSTCHGCSSASDPHKLTVADTCAPLLTCRQLHDEAVDIYRDSLHVHVCLTSEVRPQSMPCHPSAHPSPRGGIQRTLRHLSIRIHFGVSPDADVQEDMRHLWMERLAGLAGQFPALETLHVTAHLRPPIAYENLVDAIYLAGPLGALPGRVKLGMHFDYVCEEMMMDHPLLGRVWYSDALEEHTKVIEDCMADDIFRSAFVGTRYLDIMTARLLQISQEHEQPWLESLRRRKIEKDREEARMNARANGTR